MRETMGQTGFKVYIYYTDKLNGEVRYEEKKPFKRKSKYI